MISGSDRRSSDELPQEARDVYNSLIQRVRTKGAAEGGENQDAQSEGVAPEAHESDNERMSAIPSREELIARIEANEARSDARFLAFEQRVGEALNGFRTEAGEIRAELRVIETKLDGLKGIKATTIATGIGVAGVLLAALAFGGSMFDSGRDTAKMAADAQAQANAALIEIRSIVNGLQKVQPSP